MFDAGFTRFELGEDPVIRDGQQFVSGRGYASDRFEGVHRLEPHGFASMPVKGAVGAAISTRSNRDTSYVFGLESSNLRPVLPAGASALYDHRGNIIKLLGTEVEMDFQNRVATIKAGGWTVKANTVIEGNLHVTGNITTDGTNPAKHSH